MPRLTNQQYLARRTKLHAIWLECNIAYSAAPLAQRWELHRYYQTIVNVPDDQLIANREALDKAEPSLPHRAGKTYAAVVQAAGYYQARAKAPVPTTAVKSKERVITVRAVARPAPELEKLVFALSCWPSSIWRIKMTSAKQADPSAGPPVAVPPRPAPGASGSSARALGTAARVS